MIDRLRAFVVRRKRLAALLQSLMERIPLLEDAVVALIRGNRNARYARWVTQYDTLDDGDVEAMRTELSKLAEVPTLSVIVSLDGSEGDSGRLRDSLAAQIYDRWEVSFVQRSSADEWNAALRRRSDDLAFVVDARAVLRPHAFFLLARAVRDAPGVVLAYADEDAIDNAGRRSDHYFKPDWNPALLSARNYFGGVVCLRRSHALGVGGCMEELDGDCAWGLFLRMTTAARPQGVRHLPFVLSHRQCSDRDRSPERRNTVARALEQRLRRIGDSAAVEPIGEMSYRVRHRRAMTPLVSVIVPTTAGLRNLRPCIDGVINRTSYAQREVILIVNGVDDVMPEQQAYFDDIIGKPHARVLFCDEGPYNFAAINNWGVTQASGDVLCFLNDDTDVIESRWLETMVGELLRDGVGAVGAMLLFPGSRIQHAGVVLGVGGVAGHAYRGRSKSTSGYNERALVSQDLSCVTAACMVVRREAFTEVGGFDEEFAIAFNDVDFCLRLRDAGWRVVWSPEALLTHKESASIGRHNLGETGDQWTREWDLIRSKWGDELTSDPHYNPNLSLDALGLWEPAFPPRVAFPWRTPAEP